MERGKRPNTAITSARIGATRGPARPRFDFRCARCGHTLVASAAPDECPRCHGSVWERSTPGSKPASSAEQERAASFAALVGKVIGSDPVRRWRFEQLQCAGYPIEEAFALSGLSGVDLHQAIGLLEGGCAVATAMQILV